MYIKPIVLGAMLSASWSFTAAAQSITQSDLKKWDEVNANSFEMYAGKFKVKGSKDYPVSRISQSPDGKKMAISSYGKSLVKVFQEPFSAKYDTKHNQKVERFCYRGRSKHSCVHDFGPQGEFVIALDWLYMYSPNMSSEIFSKKRNRDIRINSVKFSHDGTKIITARTNGNAKLRNSLTGKKIWKLKHGANISYAEFSPDDKYIVTTGHDGITKLWDVESGKVMKSFQHGKFGKEGMPLAKFSKNGSILATTSVNNTVKLWNVTTGELINTISDNQDLISSFTFSPNGTLFATASYDGSANIYSFPSLKKITKFSSQPNKDNGKLTAVEFSRDGGNIIVGTGKGNVLFYNLENQLWIEKNRYQINIMHDKCLAKTFPTACITLGNIFEYGRIEEMDKDIAYYYYSEGCKANNRASCGWKRNHEQSAMRQVERKYKKDLARKKRNEERRAERLRKRNEVHVEGGNSVLSFLGNGGTEIISGAINQHYQNRADSARARTRAANRQIEAKKRRAQQAKRSSRTTTNSREQIIRKKKQERRSQLASNAKYAESKAKKRMLEIKNANTSTAHNPYSTPSVGGTNRGVVQNKHVNSTKKTNIIQRETRYMDIPYIAKNDKECPATIQSSTGYKKELLTYKTVWLVNKNLRKFAVGNYNDDPRTFICTYKVLNVHKDENMIPKTIEGAHKQLIESHEYGSDSSKIYNTKAMACAAVRKDTMYCN